MILTRLLPLLLPLAIATTATGCPPPKPAEAHAMRQGYSYLGERFVNGGADHDRIQVGRADGRFTSIMIVVENAPVEIFDIDVTFGDNEKFRVPTRLVFGPDSTSRMVDLPGGARVIKHVDFYYGNLRGAGQAKVELWGR